jgi:NADPH:quinone reductase-like Zn-dependent oxidoreductase
VPEGWDLVDAAAIPLVTLTGSQLVDESLAPRPGETILVTGALGSVGRTTVFAFDRRHMRETSSRNARNRLACEP